MNHSAMRRCALSVILLIPAASPATAEGILTTVAGGGPDHIPAVAANLYEPTAFAFGPAGEIYIASAGLDALFKVDASGRLTRIAGYGDAICPSPYGEGGPARHACLDGPAGVVVDSMGGVVVSDTRHSAVRRIDKASGAITRIAGNYSSAGLTGDGGPATNAVLKSPQGLALASSGDLYIADRNAHRVRKVSASTGIITTVAGTGSATGSIDGEGGDISDDLGDGRHATLASLSSPSGLGLDGSGNLFIADTGNNRVRRVDSVTGVMTTVAGTGVAGYNGDGVAATEAWLSGPLGVTVDRAGNLFIADSNDLITFLPEEDLEAHRVRRVDAVTGIITTVAGGSGRGFSGDGGAAVDALLFRPRSVLLGPAGDLFIADSLNHRLRKVDSQGDIATVAGDGGGSFGGAGFPATSASLSFPAGLAFDAAGNLFLADSRNRRVHRIDALTGILTTVAGTGISSPLGDGGPATAAGLTSPEQLALDSFGHLYISDPDVSRIRRVDLATGIISTYAGDGTVGYAGDNRLASSTSLNWPWQIAIAANGDLFIADSENNRIRRVRASNATITTVAGTGVATGSIDGPGGDALDDLNDGGPAVQASLNTPLGIAVSPGGELLIADSGNHRVRRVDPATGAITTICGNGTSSSTGDGGLAVNATFKSPDLLAFDSAGNLFVSSGTGRHVRRIDAVTKIITMVAGAGPVGFTPDGSLASQTYIRSVGALVLDGAGDLLFGDYWIGRVRAIRAEPPAAGEISPDGMSSEGPLDVFPSGTGGVILSWGRSCVLSDNDFAVYEGAIGSFTSHAPRFCSTAGLTSKSFTPAPGDGYYLVVPRNALREGSYGRAGDGVERVASTAGCAPQLAVGACP